MLSPPTPIEPEHDCASFSCGNNMLDNWLKHRAYTNQKTNASRTYVVKGEGKVVAYYSLAAGSISHAEATGKLKRNMPDPIPMVILGRLAIDAAFQGQGIGRALFRDAGLRILSAANIIGIRGVLVHAISDEAVAFYQSQGLLPSSGNTRTLMITISELQTAL